MSALCRCEQCSPDPLPTWTRLFREVCWLASMRSDEDRREYIAAVFHERGIEASRELRAAAWEHMKRRGAAVQPQQEALFA